MGIVLSEVVSEAIVTRFERVLSLYTDFRKEHHEGKVKPKRPPPPKIKGGKGEFIYVSKFDKQAILISLNVS